MTIVLDVCKCTQICINPDPQRNIEILCDTVILCITVTQCFDLELVLMNNKTSCNSQTYARTLVKT